MTSRPLNRLCGVDVLKVLSRASVKLDLGHGTESMNLAIEVSEARAAVAVLIEQRDALVTALAELTRALPKGSKSLSHIARRRTCDAERLAWSILNNEAVSPEAYDRALAKAGVP